MLADSSDTESERLPATRMNGRTRTISRLPLPRVVVDTRMTWRAALASPGGGRRSVLRVELAMRSAMPATAPRSVGFHALRHGGEVGLAVEGGKNGAAHQGGAAQTGEDGAAEPLDRDAAAVHQAADPRRRPTTAARCRDRCARPPSSIEMRRVVCPDPSPTSPSARPQRAVTATPKVPNATGTTAVDLKERHDAAPFTVRQRPCPDLLA